jgi:hypothetical protein
VYVVGFNDRLCVLMDEMGCLEFWSFCVDANVIRVYVVGADGHVSSCLGGLFFWHSVLVSLAVFCY